MKQISERTLRMIDDVVRTLNFEAKTGRSVKLEVGPTTSSLEEFTRKRRIFVNDRDVGEVVDEIDPFV